ncbi:AlkA N-terminal domain-containing protein [Vibrio agarivorans]|uniref:AlkA N-terminal domain-containing protein n=1 Tax=Vibrio agarivorans TaxID=153622 RepID=UPI0025B3853D|nr:AlkA N-terminal domain-containing protein [Vibrio agarivorans]MDN3663039.1 AlkA N-terminal domain-containing protein [Vibrio agarivorans]
MSQFSSPTLSNEQCRLARMARDRRFDGMFFIAVKTTGIFCRPICPANSPKEENVDYYQSAATALHAGYRPCKRCHPDSAPSSWRWLGVETTFQRAINEIEQGYLQQNAIPSLADKLGISDRYLRALFERYLGLSPKQYALYQQLMFAKSLIHNSQLSMTEIGFAAGFNSTRRFNDAFIKALKISPTDLRKNKQPAHKNTLSLAVRTPYDWRHMLEFYRLRGIAGIEKVEDNRYSRNCTINGSRAWFAVDFTPLEKGEFTIEVEFDLEDIRQLKNLVHNLRRMLDVDSDIHAIETTLSRLEPRLIIRSGIRIPGVWSAWEAGVRAILGQQVSVKAAIGQLNLLAATLGNHREMIFPTPQAIHESDIDFLRMPISRKETLKRFAAHIIAHPDSSPDSWLSIKGIGPWTVNYAKLRGLSEPNCFLDGDLIVKKTVSQFPKVNKQSVSPWGSYATFHCWSHA